MAKVVTLTKAIAYDNIFSHPLSAEEATNG